MSSNPSSLPADFADAVERSRDRLGRLASTILFFPTLESTNDVALMIAARTDRGSSSNLANAMNLASPGNSEGAVVLADQQTAGRGRRGQVWFSPPGSGLYVSVVLGPGRAGDPGRAMALLTLAAGVALAEAVEVATGLRVDIKWPNDLVVSRRKLAGILAEAATSELAVLGYGINVGAAAYPAELGGRATSIETELGRPIDRAALFAETLARLSRRHADLLDGRFDAILDAWRGRAPSSRGARVTWRASPGQKTGVTAGIDDRGALLVRVDDRVERIVAGELTWL